MSESEWKVKIRIHPKKVYTWKLEETVSEQQLPFYNFSRLVNSRKTEAREHFHHWPHALKLAQQLLTVKWRVWLFLCSPTPFTCFIHKYAHRHARKGFLSKSTGPSVSLRALFSFALWEKKEKFSFKEESKPYAGVACEPMALDILYHRLSNLAEVPLIWEASLYWPW